MSPEVILNRHQCAKNKKAVTFSLPVAKQEHMDRNQLLSVLPSLFTQPFIPSFSPVFPPHPDLTSLGPEPRNNCWPALLARQELEDKLPNTSREEIETDGGCGGGEWLRDVSEVEG